LEVGTSENILKMGSLNCAFCRNIKQLIYTVKSIKMCPKDITCRPAFHDVDLKSIVLSRPHQSIEDTVLSSEVNSYCNMELG